MCINWRLNLFLLVSLACALQVFAPQSNQPTQTEHRIYLDVVVTSESRVPVSDLRPQDFTILDNGLQQTITSFNAIDGRQAPVEVILVLDALNVSSKDVAVGHEGINRFLGANEGRLAYPTMVAILTNTKVQFSEDFSQDGNAVSVALDQRIAALGDIGSSADYSAAARFQISLQALRLLVEHEVGRPGRKLIIWVSPGWSGFSRAQRIGSAEREQQVFRAIVDISTQLREYQITLYSVDPLGAADIGLRSPTGMHTLRESASLARCGGRIWG